MLWVGMVLPLAALLATIYLAHETNGRFDTAFASVTKTYKVLNLLEETQMHSADAETGLRGYLLTRSENYYTLYDASVASVKNDIEELNLLIRGNPTLDSNLVQLQQLVSERLALGVDLKNAKPSTKTPVELTDLGRDTMNQIRGVLFRMREQETDLLVVQQEQAEAKFLFDQTALFVLIGVAAISLIFIIAVLLRMEHLRQIVTICSWTGQVKDDGEWIRLEDYLKKRFGLAVSHGLSKEAAEKMTEELRQAHASRSPK
jgi:CHASE3 domain sensor protein